MDQQLLAAADRIIASYNDKDFDGMRAAIGPDLDFAHFNRGGAFSRRDDLLALLGEFASTYVPDRRFLPAERVSVAGDRVIREHVWTGTAAVDVPGFAQAGEQLRMKLCSIFRFEDGQLVEWKDYG